MRHTVRKEFADYVCGRFPALASDEVLRGVFRYIAFGTFFDVDDPSSGYKGTNQLVLHYDTIRESVGVSDTSWALVRELYRLRKIFPGLEFTDPGWARARRLVSSGFDPELQERIDAETFYAATNPGGEGRVNLMTLRPATQRRERQRTYEIKQSQKAIVESRRASMSDVALFIQNYMNEKDSARFTLGCLRQNRDHVVAVVQAIPERHKRAIQYRILASMADTPHILYAPSDTDRSPRLYGQGDCMTALKSEVRRALTRGLWEADLSASQFCIFAEVVQSKPALDFIAGGRSIWSELIETYKLPQNAKKCLKETLYSIIFGMGEKRLARELEARSVPRDVLRHPILADLLQRRRRWYEEIQSAGGIRDCWGRWHPIDQANGRHAGSVGSTLIQSIELDIIAALFRLVDARFMSNYDCDIKLFQHDGCTMSLSQNERVREVSIGHMQKAVSEYARRTHNVETRLEFKRL